MAVAVGSRAHQPETGSEKRSLATRLHCASSLVESAESSPPACRLPFTCRLPSVRSVGSAVEVSNSKAAPTLSVAADACNWVAPTLTAPELAWTLKEEAPSVILSTRRVSVHGELCVAFTARPMLDRYDLC